MFTFAAYVLVIATIVVSFHFRKLQSARWSAIAVRERAKLRLELRAAWREGELSNYHRDMEKLLIARDARIGHKEMGFIYIEVPELIKWLALADQGIQTILERAVRDLAVHKLRDALNGSQT